VSREFEVMGADLLAAEAAADAAVVRRKAGEDRAASASMQRASLLAERCELPVTPALQPVDVRAALTAPERETALLAASGLSNRRIADQLLLSVRTVENRLQRVYQKLGLTRRTELAAALELDRLRR
jgi:DNA-binding NarL/FixJ family response regulator